MLGTLRKLWFDSQARSWLLQLLLLGLVAAGIYWVASTISDNLARRGIAVGFNFLGQSARFPISETWLSYSPASTYTKAFLVGLTNTLFIFVLSVVAATILGLFVGLARRSKHPIAYGISTAYVEAVRNTPLVVQLLFWYGVVTVSLPAARAALQPMPGVFLSVRGLFVPSLHVDGWNWIFAAIAVVVLSMIALRRLSVKGMPVLPGWAATGIAALILIVGVAVGGISASLDTPRLQGFNFIGGSALTPEFSALILGLVLYSASFIGEIIRGGIDAVSHGQWEAGRALGLRDHHTLRLVVIPQALRVIVPPMTSQYLSMLKNTTLAIAVGYPDISYVATTTINQTGQAIEGIAILMGVFLFISLSVSMLMNWYNKRIMLVQR